MAPTSAVSRLSTGHSINRYEVKYFVPTKILPTLVEEMGPYTRPDPNADPVSGYPIFSVYWDTPKLSFYWEKVEGVKNRRKVRFRRYVDNDTVFIEVKERIDRTLHKRRVKWPLRRVMQVFGTGRGVDWEGLGDDPVAVEVALMVDRWALQPTMGISYRRRPLLGVFNRELRVTFDTRLMYRPAPVDVGNPFTSGAYILDPRLSVMEVKYDDRVPKWLMKLVCCHGLKIVRMSKYCSAVDRHRFGGQNQ
ncbi:MAG TPA: polyphosphate polymerase domain-containing protein [Longimicrobiales bacterium]|nr:polyphosphate polymerase domain-containing protein [Longimicrobiales bacterium]